MEIQNTMERMKAGLYTLVETQLDTTSPIFCKFMKNTITKEGIYVDIEYQTGTIYLDIMEAWWDYGRSPSEVVLLGWEWREWPYGEVELDRPTWEKREND